MVARPATSATAIVITIQGPSKFRQPRDGSIIRLEEKTVLTPVGDLRYQTPAVPHPPAGPPVTPSGDGAHQVKAGAVFSALVNALVITLAGPAPISGGKVSAKARVRQ
jgi:hypothetical protein